VEPREPRTSSAPESQVEYRSFNVIVGEAIRRHRQERGWTQAFLAEQAGLSPNYIARLERGELGPSLFVAHRICLALSVELEILVTPIPGGVEGAQARRSGAQPKRRALTG
jgi:transcriptional regulator with XRE-family HTH domain